MLTKGELAKRMGLNLRRLRLEHKLPIRDLAQMMGVTPGYLGLIENGKRGLTPFMMYKVGEILDIFISELFETRG